MIILFLLLFSFSANAEVVQAIGYGANPNQALENAKSKAIEMVAGSWVDVSKTNNNGNYSEEVNQFTTGTIESYKVIDSGFNKVVIEADVIKRKDNSIDSKSINVNQSQLNQALNNLKNQNSSGEALDTLTRAIDFKIKKITPLKEEDGIFYVSVLGDVSYSKKWVNDYKEFRNLNQDYKFVILKTENIYAYAELNIDGQKKYAKSITLINLPKKTIKDRNGFEQDILDFNSEVELEIVIPFEKIEDINILKIILKCEEEIVREKEIKFW